MAVVLVVNDDRDMLDMYESVLQAMGHEPITKLAIETGPETVRQVGATALLVDMEAPDEADFGLRIIQEVREDRGLADLPIILATGATERVAPHRDLFDALNIPVLIKPFPIDALEEKLRAVLMSREP
jgi:DNA-binding response OmpR family regulator